MANQIEMNVQEENSMDKKSKQQLSQSQLFELGFTRKMIKTLLPPPTLKDNPYFKDGAPLKLWDKSVVDAAMDTDYFREYHGRPSYKNGIPLSEWDRLLRG